MPELQPRQRPAGWKFEPRTSSALLRSLFSLLDALPYSYSSVARRAGIGVETLTKMKFGHNSPKLVTVESLVNALGYRLELVKAGGSANGHQRAAAWALRVHEEIVDITLDEHKAQQWAAKGWTVVRLIEEENGHD